MTKDEIKELEEIEKELGFSILTLLKAQKNGFYYWSYNGHTADILKTKPNAIIGIDFDDKIISSGWLLDFKLCDYGKKTLYGWALTKEELEEEE